MAGFSVTEIRSNDRGTVDLDALRAELDSTVAGIMLTVPNTLGIFEENILEVTRAVHDAGGLCYFDGANLNSFIGRARPGDMGADVFHFNLHKTLSTPHGGGGPGAGAVAVSAPLVDYLPVPWIVESSGRGAPGLGPSQVGRQRALVLRELPRRGEGVRLPAAARRQRLARGQRERRPERELPPRAPQEDLPAPVRSSLQARIRAVRREPSEPRLDARCGEATHRLRSPSSDDLLPAHRSRGSDDRADGDGRARVARPIRRDPRDDRARGAGEPRSRCAMRRCGRRCGGSTRRRRRGTRF